MVDLMMDAWAPMCGNQAQMAIHGKEGCSGEAHNHHYVMVGVPGHCTPD